MYAVVANACEEAREHVEQAAKGELGSDDARQLLVRARVGGGERRDVDGIPNGLIARRVDDVAQHLFGILNAAALVVLVAQEDELVLLAGPEAAHTLLVELDDAKAQMALVQHDHLVLVRVVAELVTQREERGDVAEHGATPHRIALVGDDRLGVELGDVLVQRRLVAHLVLEVVLMQAQAHAHRTYHHLFEYVHVGEDPLVLERLNAHVALE